MMSDEEFIVLFKEVLGEMPAEQRSAILAYWEEWGVEPVFLLRDSDIRKELPNKVEIACVSTYYSPCYNRFAFREFLKEAPHDVLKTIMRHELLHCYSDRDFTKKKWAEEQLREMTAFQRPKTIFIKSCEDGLRRYAEARAIQREELFVGALNKGERPAWEWCQQYIKEHALPRWA